MPYIYNLIFCSKNKDYKKLLLTPKNEKCWFYAMMIKVVTFIIVVLFKAAYFSSKSIGIGSR